MRASSQSTLVPAAAPAASASTTASTTITTPAATTLFPGLGFGDNDLTSADRCIIQLIYGFHGLGFSDHLHEGKPPGPARILVGNQGHRLHIANSGKGLPYFVLCSIVGQPTYKQFLDHANAPSLLGVYKALKTITTCDYNTRRLVAQ